MNGQKLFYTTNLKAATALLTMGFKKVALTRMIRRDGKESIVYWFDAINDEGTQANVIYEGMTTGGDALMKKDPGSVVNYMRCFASNRDELIADIKATPRMAIIEKDGKKIAISENATEATKKAIAAMI
jgi:hypothetical protein